METLDRQNDLFEQEWITAFVTAGELLRRDTGPVDLAVGSSADGPDPSIPYDTWDWLD